MLNGPKPARGCLTIRRILPAGPATVFRAWTDPEWLSRWMSPTGDAEVSVDVRPGGSLRVLMKGPGRVIEHTGHYRDVDPPHRLVFTWQSEFTGETPSLVTVTLRPHASGTELLLRHEQLPPDQVEPHAGGWGTLFEHLARVVLDAAGRPATE